MYLEEQNSLFEAHGAVQFAWVDLVGFMYMDFLCCGILSTRSGADFVLRDGKINKSCLFGKVRGSLLCIFRNSAVLCNAQNTLENLI